MKKMKAFGLILIGLLICAGCSAKSGAPMASGAGSAAPAPAPAATAPSAPAPASSEVAASASSEASASAAADNTVAVERKEDIQIQPRPGQLTAGEWSDNQNWRFFKDLLGQNQEWQRYQRDWSMFPTSRIAVHLTFDGRPAANQTVVLKDGDDKTMFEAVTNASGDAYLFYDLFEEGRFPAVIQSGFSWVPLDGMDLSEPIEIGLTDAEDAAHALDLMFVVDTTGSMGDELEYLKTELQNVTTQVKEANPNLKIRLSANFYRDHDDEYTVRDFPFTEDVAKVVAQIAAQNATGGGDFEEAVELALENAIYQHEWNPEAKARVMFLVLDAPPHLERDIVQKMHKIILDASAEGIQIVPIASSGIDKGTEFLLRCLAVTTNGSYVFLTDDSGIGESHLEPTIGAYQVEFLNELMVKVINKALNGE